MSSCGSLQTLPPLPVALRVLTLHHMKSLVAIPCAVGMSRLPKMNFFSCSDCSSLAILPQKKRQYYSHYNHGEDCYGYDADPLTDPYNSAYADSWNAYYAATASASTASTASTASSPSAALSPSPSACGLPKETYPNSAVPSYFS